MKVLRATLLLALGATPMVSACGDDSGAVVTRKGIVDEAALTSGVTITLSGQTGSLVVPFIEPVPDIDDDELSEEVKAAVTLSVRSPASGATADFSSGTLVEGTPSAAGEWSFELNEDRDAATLTFFNQSPGGLTLKASNSYTATLSLSTNRYVERLSTFTIQQVTVTGG